MIFFAGIKNKHLVLLGILCALGSNAYADEGSELAHKHMCTSCHLLDKKSMGPSWQNIARRYKPLPNKEAYLTDKIRNGGSGAWGKAAMPPSLTIDNEDIKILAHYIIGLD